MQVIIMGGKKKAAVGNSAGKTVGWWSCEEPEKSSPTP